MGCLLRGGLFVVFPFIFSFFFSSWICLLSGVFSQGSGDSSFTLKRDCWGCEKRDAIDLQHLLVARTRNRWKKRWPRTWILRSVQFFHHLHISHQPCPLNRTKISNQNMHTNKHSFCTVPPRGMDTLQHRRNRPPPAIRNTHQNRGREGISGR